MPDIKKTVGQPLPSVASLLDSFVASMQFRAEYEPCALMTITYSFPVWCRERGRSDKNFMGLG